MELENKVVFLNFDKVIDTITALSGGGLILVGSRPSVGKTWFALKIIETMANKHGKSSCIFSIEMSKEAIEKRLSIMNFDINNNLMHLIDKPNIDLSEIIEIIKRKKHEAGVKLFFIDYLSLIGNKENKDIFENAKELKSLAIEENIVLVGLMQLDRNTNNPKPEITNFKSTENHADIIIALCHSEKSMNLSEKEIEIQILKDDKKPSVVNRLSRSFSYEV